MKAIKFRDLEKEYAVLRPKVRALLDRTMSSAHFISGPELKEFEGHFADFCRAKHAVGVASGTAALHLALLACGIGRGDEVITTTMSFNATAEAIAYTGATPVFVDVVPTTLSIDPVQVERAVTSKTKAILPVHLYGIPAEMDALKQIAKKHHLLVIEDCAQAHGTKYKGRSVGTLGDIGCFSFMPAKNLGAFGDAGCIITDKKAYAERVMRLRDHGRTEKYVHGELGYAERLDTMQAVVLDLKLKYLEEWNERRRAIAAGYDKYIDWDKVSRITIPDHAQGNYYVYVIQVNNQREFMDRMRGDGVPTGIYYPIPCHLQPVFKSLGYRLGALPVAEKASRKIVALPMHAFITQEQVKYIASRVNRYAK